MTDNFKRKSFWRKPEGITGAIFLIGGLILAGNLISKSIGAIIAFANTPVGLGITLGILGVLLFMALDNKARTLISYMYKSTMRWITGLFVQIDPIGILKSYVDDLKGNLRKMTKQIGKLRGQMHKLKEMIHNNQKEIKTNMQLASKAKQSQQKAVMILKSRKAGRLKDSNLKLDDLYKRMEVLYRVLSKMYENSAILAEDIEDQVKLKEQERKAMLAGHSAMKSAMSIIKGDSDKKAMFDQALEAIADDVSSKVGEMERFMEMSESFMSSIDLQNGIFEEKGMQMLEEWENKSTSLLLGGAKEDLISMANNDDEVLDLNQPVAEPQKSGRTNQYDNFFD
ncbi:MAG: hypothetical protein HKO66_10960 [Saprospiraceae bacterium]|nr:hypothetical protein [Bacteroidia bacterium]NNE14346.1 hypothetical protein [Saprospiraceae bacterium]NNL92745.1 hypothetical protein [Saprospiraceae bacterium]